MAKPAPYEEYQRQLLRSVAEGVGVPFRLLTSSHRFGRSYYAEAVERERAQAHLENRTVTILLLSQWVSEVEPVLWCDSSGRVRAVGTAAEPVIFHPLWKFARNLFRAFPIHQIEAPKWPNG